MGIWVRLRNVRLRAKLLAAFGSILILALGMVLFSLFISAQTEKYERANRSLDNVLLAVAEIDGSINRFTTEGFKEKTFQETRQSPQLDEFNRQLELLAREIESLRSAPASDDKLIESLANQLNLVNQKVQELVRVLGERGFRDYGVEGKLRKAIHEVETLGLGIDKADLLMLRRHEKDFFLRHDLKYRDEFNKLIDREIDKLKTNEGNTKVAELLNFYRQQFNTCVTLDITIGLKDTDGIKGVLNNSVLEMKKASLTLNDEFRVQSDAYKSSSRVVLIAVFAVQVLLSILLAVLYADAITKPIKEIRGAVTRLSNGEFPTALPVRGHEEIGQTKAALNQLLDRLQAAVGFSASLGKGNLNAEYDERFRGDVLSNSLISMQNQLSAAQRNQEMINWVNKGAAALNDIIKDESKELEFIGDNILKFLVTYLNMNQGALYVRRDEIGETYLHRLSTYAYGKKKFLNDRVEPGSGLVGACYLERSRIVLKEVPQNYVKITSGLGEATPDFVLIAPMMIKGEVFGVIELAGFQELPEYRINFVETIGESVASILQSKYVQIQTTKLLREAREREEQMKSQEEELRQNAEELQAVQEQMERRQQELEARIRELELQSSHSVSV